MLIRDGLLRELLGGVNVVVEVADDAREVSSVVEREVVVEEDSHAESSSRYKR